MLTCVSAAGLWVIMRLSSFGLRRRRGSKWKRYGKEKLTAMRIVKALTAARALLLETVAATKAEIQAPKRTASPA